jgi:hypothetical protein
MKTARVLYVSPLDLRSRNGMNQQQLQLLSMLCSADIQEQSVDMLSLGAPPSVAREWVQQSGLPIRVLDGAYATLAHLNCALWYGGGVIFCNKLKWVDRFYFPLRTPLPRRLAERYDLIVCYYSWGHRLLALDRAGNKVVMDLGDIMADRHTRIGARRWISMAARDEEAVFRSGSRCLAVSDEDADEFEHLYGIRPGVIRFVPPDADRLMEIAEGARLPRIGFMGAPSYGNEEALRILARPEFLDPIRAAGIELVVAGGICDTASPEVLSALKTGGAKLLGRVRSSLDYYREIAATVNPIGPSTGVKIKSVETLVAGRNLITTMYGADRNLQESFPGQIVCTDWPVHPGTLASLAITVVGSAQQTGGAAARAYVDTATRALRELHRV